MERPSWDETFINMLDVLKNRSSCVKLKTSAIITKGSQIVAMGYNGTFEKYPECSSIYINLYNKYVAELRKNEENYISYTSVRTEPTTLTVSKNSRSSSRRNSNESSISNDSQESINKRSPSVVHRSLLTSSSSDLVVSAVIETTEQKYIYDVSNPHIRRHYNSPYSSPISRSDLRRPYIPSFEEWMAQSDTKTHHREWSKANEIHAEANALGWISKNDNAIYTMYTLYSPCDACAKEIIKYKNVIKTVIYKYKYSRGNDALRRLKTAGIICMNYLNPSQ